MIESALLNAASNPQSFTGFGTGGSLYNLSFLLAIFAIVISLRIYREINGRMYSTARVLRLPVTYVIFTLFEVLVVGLIDPILIAALVLIPVGVFIGDKVGTKVKFFNRNNMVYYIRSPVIMIIWLASFIGRVIIEFALPQSFTLDLVFDLLLSATTGLLIGEALNIIRKRKEYVEPVKSEPGQDDSFRINM